MEETERKNTDFVARTYQEEILKIAMKQNTIIYLPTGSGKTYIAILLIKHLSEALAKPIHEGGKITVFLVNTVTLVEQHYNTMNHHMDFRCGRFSGDMAVDFWTKSDWENQLKHCQIITLTAQIFLDICMHGYFKIEQANLIIFDECHQAVDNHAMRRIMKEFEHCPKEKQPRVLGLTATLLNSNCKSTQVMTLVESLETTFHSKVATVAQLAEVLGFSTNPKERIEAFNLVPNSHLMDYVMQKLKNLISFIGDIKFSALEKKHEFKQLLNSEAKVNKVFTHMLDNLLFHLEMLGIYGAWKASLFYLIMVERMKQQAEDKLVEKVLYVISTTLTEIMKMFETEMSGFSESEKIFRFSSPKMLKLLNILRNFKQKLCGIVFVQRRITAKILYYIIKALANNCSDFEHIKTDFLVGLSANFSERENAETLFSIKQSKRVMRNFNDGEINLLVASNVVEEGIDIPQCTLVVKFDYPTNYRSYIQSKGRARHKDSEYVIMVPSGKEETVFHSRYDGYQEIESILEKFLIGQNDLRKMPELQRIQKELYNEDILEPYFVNGPESAHVSMLSAISLVNRYCQSLCKDNYCIPAPDWYIEFTHDNKIVVPIEMPIMCPLRETVRGIPMTNRNDAKRATALEVCKRLHQIGELTDNLLPVNEEEHILTNYDYLFVHWINEDKEIKPGTKKRVRMHDIFIPPFLINQSISFGTVAELYLHTIDIKSSFTKYTETSNIILMQHELVESNLKYGLLTSGQLPKICDFPLYLSAGEVNIHINVNAKRIILTEHEMLKIRKFNIFVYGDILKCLKNFLIFDNSNESGNILTAPIYDNGNNIQIAFDVIDHKMKLQRNEQPSNEEKMKLEVTDEKYLGNVVWPWYRPYDPDLNYIVIKVCHDMSPMSPFPTSEYNSFAEYYGDKYRYHIVNKNQPLLLVKAMSKRLNCLKPRSVTLHGKRSKYLMLDGTEEHLVPEMCILQNFPAALWYKAYLLPSIVHRVEYLLKAEYLRRKINEATKIGIVDLPNGIDWDPLVIDESILKVREQKPTPVPQRNAAEGDVIPLPPASIKTSSLLPVNKDYARKMLEKQYPWTDEDEPMDIERNIENVTILEIVDFEKFLKKTSISLEKNITQVYDPRKNLPALPENTISDDNYIFKPIKMLDKQEPFGPQLWEMYQILMSSKANDIVNLERLETLGDSFLKMSCSLFLFLKYPQYNEGRLTSIKTKMIGNRNLFYIGQYNHLSGMIKVADFSPCNDWLQPGFCIPKMLRDHIIQNKREVDYLFNITFDDQEIETGLLNPSTVDNLETIIESINFNEIGEDEQSISTIKYHNKQYVPDKTVSDIVEALLGAYVHSNGIHGGLSLLGYLDIIPKSENPVNIFKLKPPSPFFFKKDQQELSKHLPNAQAIEARLGYTFKNKGYLLQALTHASYTACRITDCYQRLEFLGDAVLDYLVTCHIYEITNDLTPGQLTDLRSALVNNITFACLCVRHGFHKHLKSLNTKLLDVIDIFVKYQEERNFVIDEGVLILLEEESEMNIAEHVHIPKALGDLFEALAGAVFLDTGFDLQETWKVFHRIMHKEIEMFHKNVPKNPVRLLYEYSSAAPHFDDPKPVNSNCTAIGLSVTIGGKKQVVHGFGENKAMAKRAAAKMALRLLQKHDAHH